MTSHPEKTATEPSPMTARVIDFDTRMDLQDIPDGTKPFVHDELVEDLEALLVKAKSGQIIALAYASVTFDKGLSSGWTGAAHTKHSLLAAVMCLHRRVIEAFTG